MRVEVFPSGKYLSSFGFLEFSSNDRHIYTEKLGIQLNFYLLLGN